MSGGSVLVAETTNYRFMVSYSSNCGIAYRSFEVRRLKPAPDKWGHRESEWVITVYADGMTEEENARLYDAFKELEYEHNTALRFDALTKEQRALSDIWADLKEWQQNARTWEKRARDAEGVISKLRTAWYEIEEREREKPEGDKDA